MKYGIKVPIALDNHGEHTDWLWVVDYYQKPRLYETKEQAQKDALLWGPNAIVEEYDESKNSY